MVSGQTIVPTNWTSESQEQHDHDGDATGIAVSRGDKMVQLGPVIALTDMAKKEIPV